MANNLARPQVFKYERPEVESGKAMVWLCRSDLVVGLVQVLKEGGENNLHSHAAMDSFWMVLNGRVLFYGENDALIGDLGRYEGLLMPRGCKYWFESASSEPLELLQVAGYALGAENTRTDYTPRQESMAVRHYGSEHTRSRGSASPSR